MGQIIDQDVTNTLSPFSNRTLLRELYISTKSKKKVEHEMNHTNLSFIVLILARGGTAFFHLKLIQHLCFYFATVPLPLTPGPLTPLLAD